MGDAGLHYHYHTFGKTLSAMEVDLFGDAQGVKHDWRKELLAEIARRQKPSGAYALAL